MVTNPNDPRPLWLKTLLEVLRLVVTIAAAILAALTATGCQWTARLNENVMSSRVDVLTTITPSIIPMENDQWQSQPTPTVTGAAAATGTPAAEPRSQATPSRPPASAAATSTRPGSPATTPWN